MKVVLCCGCFDILHYGHVLHLKVARSLGDRLIVALTDDEQVAARKGMGHPVFSVQQRAEVLKALRCVDLVIIYNEPTPERVIREVRPAIYAKGAEYEGNLPELDLVLSLGGKVVFTETPKWSSTALMGRMQ